MANGSDHAWFGGCAGAAFAFLKVPENAAGAQKFAELLGGILGGLAGARLPDIVDPPTNPNHRGLGHGVIPVAIVATKYQMSLSQNQEDCRHFAAEQWRASQSAPTELDRYIFNTLGFIGFLVSGLAAGLLAGYVSHIALDATTPKSLPLIG